MYIKNDMFHLSFLTKLVMISILSFPIIQNHLAMRIGYLKRHVDTGWGSIVWKGHDKITVIFLVTLDNLLSAATTLLTGGTYIYIFTVFMLCECVYDIFLSCHFFYSIYVCHDLFNELCRYIMYNCRLKIVLIY